MERIRPILATPDNATKRGLGCMITMRGIMIRWWGGLLTQIQLCQRHSIPKIGTVIATSAEIPSNTSIQVDTVQKTPVDWSAMIHLPRHRLEKIRFGIGLNSPPMRILQWGVIGLRFIGSCRTYMKLI